MTNPKRIFCLTGGRTGTMFLSHLISANVDITSVHEPLGVVDFGTRMPDIRTMRMFNEKGFNTEVKSFWKRKFALLPTTGNYSETNHTLAKCGLIEHIMSSPELQRSTTIISLGRADKVSNAISHLKRGDFQNFTIDWQWYLNMRYKNLIVNPNPFLEYGRAGYIFWFIEELSARQEYYKTLYSHKIKFVDAVLEQISKDEGASKLLSDLELGELKTIPQAANQSSQSNDPAMVQTMKDVFEKTRGLANEAANQYFKAGKRLHIDSLNNPQLP